jgi:hypothetical protein
VKTATYIIRNAAEEFECPWCGQPLLVGDRATHADDERGETCACSSTCADADLHRQAYRARQEYATQHATH